MANAETLHRNNRSEIGFWAVITEDEPTSNIAGVYPRVFTSEADARKVAKRYRRNGYDTAEARYVEMDARSMIHCCEETRLFDSRTVV